MRAKYNYGDYVVFKIALEQDEPAKEYIGRIAIIDHNGTFEQNDEPSYDIYVEELNCLFKHCRESSVVFYKETDGSEVM